jgi:hypothetical protein
LIGCISYFYFIDVLFLAPASTHFFIFSSIAFARKGKEAITIGKEAKPTLSRLLTKSDDVQIKSPKEAAKLTDDVLTEE